MKQQVVVAHTRALDDWKFDADGNVMEPGGRAVADWLAAELGNGRTVANPENHSNYGWSFDVMDESGRAWCLLAMGPSEDTMYFWAERRPGLKRLFGIGVGPRIDLLEMVRGLLCGDDRFDDVKIISPEK